MKGCTDFYLKAMARIWPLLFYMCIFMCHIRSTAQYVYCDKVRWSWYWHNHAPVVPVPNLIFLPLPGRYYDKGGGWRYGSPPDMDILGGVRLTTPKTPP